jgi:hypothetical protein
MKQQSIFDALVTVQKVRTGGGRRRAAPAAASQRSQVSASARSTCETVARAGQDADKGFEARSLSALAKQRDQGRLAATNRRVRIGSGRARHGAWRLVCRLGFETPGRATGDNAIPNV